MTSNNKQGPDGKKSLGYDDQGRRVVGNADSDYVLNLGDFSALHDPHWFNDPSAPVDSVDWDADLKRLPESPDWEGFAQNLPEQVADPDRELRESIPLQPCEGECRDDDGFTDCPEHDPRLDEATRRENRFAIKSGRKPYLWAAPVPCPQCQQTPCDLPALCKGSAEAQRRNRRSLDVIGLDEVTTQRVVYLWQRRIPRGALTLMPGVEGVGKTTLGIRIMADLTRGTLPGEYFGKPQNVLVLAFEDGLGDVIKPRFEQAGADLSRVKVLKCARTGDVEDGQTDRIVVPRDLDLIGIAAENYAAPFIWIDSLVTTLPDDLKTVAYKETASALKAVNDFAEVHRLAVVSPWHLNKADSTDARIRMMDSRAFATATRSILLVVEDPDQPGQGVGIVAADKANASSTADTPALRYRLVSAPYEIEEEDPDTGTWATVTGSCGVAEWAGELDGNGRELARAMLARPTTLAKAPDARPSAAEWLEKYLSDNGESWRDQVMLDGTKPGVDYSESSIKRAATKLGVVFSEETVSREGSTPLRKTVWSLPARH